jgi:hypothetical protein
MATIRPLTVKQRVWRTGPAEEREKNDREGVERYK